MFLYFILRGRYIVMLCRFMIVILLFIYSDSVKCFTDQVEAATLSNIRGSDEGYCAGYEGK